MKIQPEFLNLLRSLKPFVNEQGVVALTTLENVFEILEDPKVQALYKNMETFAAMRKTRPTQPGEDTT
ncbi:MAG TPA: hypothetical protein GXX34_05425 [Clostridia bacterium]|nr:hypothetical protein [Clostridia bacterium]